MIFLLGLALTPVVLIIFFNIWLACIISKQINAVYRTRRSIISSKEELKKYDQNLRKQIRRKKNRKQLGLVKAFGAILVSNIIMWMPLVFHTIVTLIVDSSQIPLGNYSFVYISFITHSVLHPLFEGWLIPEIRSSIKTFLGVSFLQKRWKRLREGKAREESNAVSYDLSAQDRVDDSEERCCGCCKLCRFAMAVDSLEYSENPEWTWTL